MPKLFLPPQGGEKWLCIFTFLFMMLRWKVVIITSIFVSAKIIIFFKITLTTMICLHLLPSVVCCVVMIYCIVIIYLPSLTEADSNFLVSLELVVQCGQVRE